MFAEHPVGGVVHLAGRKQVAESVADPLRYYGENVDGVLALLEAYERVRPLTPALR